MITKQDEDSKDSCKNNSVSVSPKEWGHSMWFFQRGLRLKPLERTPTYSYTVYNSAGHLLADCAPSSCSSLTCAPSKKTLRRLSQFCFSLCTFWRTRRDKPLKAPLPRTPPPLPNKVLPFCLPHARTRNSCQRRAEKRPSPKWKAFFSL